MIGAIGTNERLAGGSRCVFGAGTINIHVEDLKPPRGGFSFSTWTRIISSEVSFDSSEVLFLAHVENFQFPRGDLRISTWGSASSKAKPIVSPR